MFECSDPVEALKCLLALQLSRPGNVARQPAGKIFMYIYVLPIPFGVDKYIVRFCLSKLDSQFC